MTGWNELSPFLKQWAKRDLERELAAIERWTKLLERETPTPKVNGMIEAIQSPDLKAKASPMTHEETRDWLRQHGFDLSKQLSWWDDPETNCRHFTQ